MTHDDALATCTDRGMYLLPLDIGSPTFESEMTEIGVILDRLTDIRWGLRLWLPYQLIDGAWVSDYGGQNYNEYGLPWATCNDPNVQINHTNQPSAGGAYKPCLQYRIDGIRYGTDEMCVWGLYNDKCTVPRDNRYVVCTADYTPEKFVSSVVNPNHASFIPNRTRSLRSTFDHFLMSDENIFTTSFDEITANINDLFVPLNGYQVKNGLEVNLDRFDRFILSLLWSGISDDGDADQGAFGPVIFGSGQLVNFVTNMKLDGLVNENFDGWTDPIDVLKTQNLKLGQCSNYREKFTEIWDSWYNNGQYGDIENQELFSAALDVIEKQSKILPSQYLLAGYVFSVLWDNGNEGAEYVNFVLDARDYLMSQNFQIDSSDVKGSFLSFFQEVIHNVQESDLQAEMQDLFDNGVNTHLLNSYSFKYALISTAEDAMECNPADNAENNFVNKLVEAQLTSYFENSQLGKLRVLIHDLAGQSGTTAPNVDAIYSSVLQTTSGNPPTPPPCDFYVGNKKSGCGEPRCDMISAEFVDAWKNKRNQRMWKYGWALEIDIPSSEYDQDGWSIVVRTKSNARGSFQVWNANFFGFYERAPGLLFPFFHL